MKKIEFSDKTKSAFKAIVKYVRELSIVVAGIAITFTVSDTINRRNENKEIKRHLSAIKMELEDNMTTVNELYKYYDHAKKLRQYLNSDVPEKLSTDTLSKYEGIYGFYFITYYSTNAFDLFKTSDSIHLLKDRGLLNSILKAYVMLERTRDGSDAYMKRKMDEIYNTTLQKERIGNSSQYTTITSPDERRLFNFYSINYNLDDLIKDCKVEIQETIDLLNKQL